jgi:hypothetical protein
MIRIARIHPDGAAIAIVKELPGFSVICRPIQAGARRGQKHRGPGFAGQTLKGMHVGIDEGLGRAVKVRIPVAPFGKPPRLPRVIRPEDSAHLGGRKCSRASKCKITHAARLR